MNQIKHYFVQDAACFLQPTIFYNKPTQKKKIIILPTPYCTNPFHNSYIFLFLSQDTIQPPSGSSMEQIKHYLSKMQKASSPLDKLKALQGATNTMVSGVQSRDRGSSVSSQSTNSTQLATDGRFSHFSSPQLFRLK